MATILPPEMGHTAISPRKGPAPPRHYQTQVPTKVPVHRGCAGTLSPAYAFFSPHAHLKEPRLPGQGRLAGLLQIPAAPGLATGDQELVSSGKVSGEG